MKQRKALVIMLAVVVLLTGIYIGLKLLPKEDEEANKHYVMSLPSPAEVTSFMVEYGVESYGLYFEDGTWYLEDDKTFPVDQQKAQNMANGLLSVFADRETDAPMDAAEYGLEPPQCRVTACDADGCEYAYRIGDLNDYTGLYYLKYEDSEKVYLTDSTLPTLFLRGRWDMIEVERLPDIYKTEVTGVSILRDGKRLKINKTEDGWEDYTEDMDALAASFTGLYLYDCAAYGVKGTELARYGLDKPSAEVTLYYVKTETRYTGEDEEGNPKAEKIEVEYDITLLFGSDTADGYTYVMPKGSDRVYTASQSECHIITDACK